MNQSAEGCPAHILAQPAAERLAYFTTRMVAHPRLKAVHEAVLQVLRQPASTALLVVFGPTGVGKTTLRLRLEHQLWAEAVAASAGPLEHVPIVGVEAQAPESGSFNWKDYYRRALRALHDPVVYQKIDYGIRGVRQDSEGRLILGPNVVVTELRSALEQALAHRRPLAVLVDEAQHLKKMASGRRVLDQMDTIKSLANTTQTLHILLGTYDILGLTQLSGQLSRRSEEIHFGRYHYDDPVEQQQFRRVLYTFQGLLPLPDAPDLVGRAEYCYERCLGCVGVLKTWLTQALAAALNEGLQTLTPAILERTALPTRHLVQMARELVDGEARVAGGEGQMSEVRSLLGLEPTSSTGTTKPATGTRAARPVGQRKPHRDPVGEVAS